ncbi:hypothetical protein DSECCO2_396500 [anaerobic digester metagenome]
MVIAMAETILEQQIRRTEGQEFFSSEDVVGKRVKNPEGYDLGEISSLRVGLPTGKVTYAVLRTGGMFGLGAKHFAVPIEAMVYRPGDDVFVVNISKHRIENEPGFSESEWPKEANWALIESRRPMGPPSQEEARAVTRTEPPPREVVTTERVEVREKVGREGMPITADEVEGRTEVTRPTTVVPGSGTVTAERTEIREKPAVVEEMRPVTEAHAPMYESIVRGEEEETAAERPVRAGGPSPGHLSAAGLQTYLKGMDYPAGRQDLIAHAREHNAPEHVITTLTRFSDRTYRSAADVSAEFGSEVRGGQPARAETGVGGVREEPTVAPRRAPSLAHLSATDLQVYLKGIDYPVGRQDLITHARKNGASESVIAALEQFSDRTYRSAADVGTEFGKVR